MSPIAFSDHLQQSSLRQRTIWLFLGIAAVLLLATLMSETLRWRARWRARGRPSAVLDNLVARIRA
ncbi:hypothetical protein XTPLMG730_3792 [Xanthomonas translucens pv. phlei]|uniref:Uncharacterized protein n=1 Tax=Xanthomonas graminis pv. phlei TaxID=487906 RepID=A0A0K3A7G2_9XANT|nr:hypothetical protein XTPLMG730_3792 [Xanthomonas translucens pv. phlei]